MVFLVDSYLLVSLSPNLPMAKEEVGSPLAWRSDSDVFASAKVFPDLSAFLCDRFGTNGASEVMVSTIQDGNVVLVFATDIVIKMHHHSVHDGSFALSLPNGVCESVAFGVIGGLSCDDGMTGLVRRGKGSYAVRLGRDDHRVCIEMERHGVSLFDWMCPISREDMTIPPSFDVSIPDSTLIRGGMFAILSDPCLAQEGIDLVNEFLISAIFQVVAGISQLYRHSRFVHGDLHCRQVLFVRKRIGSLYTDRRFWVRSTEYMLRREKHPSVCLIDMEHCTFVQGGIEYSGHVDGYCNTSDASYDLYRFCSSLVYYSCLTHEGVWNRVSADTRRFIVKHARLADMIDHDSPVAPHRPPIPPPWAMFTPHLVGACTCEEAVHDVIFDRFRVSNTASSSPEHAEKAPEERTVLWANVCERFIGRSNEAVTWMTTHHVRYKSALEGMRFRPSLHLDDQACARLDEIIVEVGRRTLRLVENMISHVYPGCSLEFSLSYMWLEMLKAQQGICMVMNYMLRASRMPRQHRGPSQATIRVIAHVLQGYVRHRWICGSWDSVAIRNRTTGAPTYSVAHPRLDISGQDVDKAVCEIQRCNCFALGAFREHSMPINACMPLLWSSEDADVKIQSLRRHFETQMSSYRSFIG